MKVIPSHILEKMNPEDRAPLGPAGFTRKECEEIYCKKTEKKLHQDFEQWLRLNDLPYIHSRMDKKTSIQNGAPDFIVFANGFTVCIEFKVGNNKTSDDQNRFIDRLIQSKIPVAVCYSLVAAINFTKEKTGLLRS
jgi:hypothetical protein